MRIYILLGQIYYRFNPYLTEYLSIDETRSEKFQLMRESTQMYMRRNDGKVRDACQQVEEDFVLQKFLEVCIKTLFSALAFSLAQLSCWWLR